MRDPSVRTLNKRSHDSAIAERSSSDRDRLQLGLRQALVGCRSANLPVLCQARFQSDRDPGQSRLGNGMQAVKHSVKHHQVSGVHRHQLQSPIGRVGHASGLCWKIEEFPGSEAEKGIERFQCYEGRIQLNPIACGLMVCAIAVDGVS
ncbi:hypothetical protein [Rubidibacter lacunae]|uniref:hypothetical protein n=1 Tax=Rubidibacter lacunae TaxID=582514 RepID=UPI0003F5FEB9|nr:hypothetical protein [Rubidibacter lacunae]